MHVCELEGEEREESSTCKAYGKLDEVNIWDQPSKWVHETGEEASLGKVEWVEMSGRSDLWQKDSTKSVKQGLKVGSETW